MYRILFHILVISVIEIIFYFNYVGPLESRIFKDSFVTPTPDTNHEIFINNNTINYINDNYVKNITDIYEKESQIGENERDDHNHRLYQNTLNYWYCSLGISIFIFIIEIIIKKYIKKLKDKRNNDNFEGIELTPINSDSSMINLIENDKNKLNCNKIKILKTCLFYLFLFGGIFLFEYIFFQKVILNYHIISKKELEYLIIKSYLPFFNNLFISNN